MNPENQHQEVYQMETPAGIRITEFVRQMVQYANDHNVEVHAEFNGVPLVAIPTDTTTALLMVYEAAIAARETKKAKEPKRFTLESIDKILDYVKTKRFQHGGEYLGVMRRWIQRRFRNGATVQWGSAETLDILGSLTAHEMDQLAQEICDATLQQYRESIMMELRSVHGDILVAQQGQGHSYYQDCPGCIACSNQCPVHGEGDDRGWSDDPTTWAAKGPKEPA
jgi:hypothetical protein